MAPGLGEGAVLMAVVSSLKTLAKLLANDRSLPLLWGPQEAIQTATPDRESWGWGFPVSPALSRHAAQSHRPCSRNNKQGE